MSTWSLVSGDQGRRDAPGVDLTKVGIAASSKIEWSSSELSGSSVTIQTSLDSVTWSNATNGGSIPGIAGNMAGQTLYIREILERLAGGMTPTLSKLIASVSPETPDPVQFQYRTDFDLGDIVTIRDLDWGVTADLRITELALTLEANKPLQIQATFGEAFPNLVKSLRKDISQASADSRD